MMREIRPQAGPQEAFLASSADIVIYGGAAGGGKTYALLLEPLRNYELPGFGAVIFRRTSPQIRNEGGLWDTSELIYPSMGFLSRESTLEWEYPASGVTVKFAHLQLEKDKYDWDGSQIPLIAFDELIHFTQSQFWYMLSRNRSTCGVKPYIRATTNPDVDSWVADLIAWWIEQDEASPNYGLPIVERAGVVRWFVRVNDDLIWADSEAELAEVYPAMMAKSLTFIPAKLEDNRILMDADPSYLANLMAQSRVERERLLGGNWKIRAVAGMFFQRSWFEMLPAAPTDVTARVRYWDFAGTEAEKSETGPSGPAYTAGVLMSRGRRYTVEDVVRERLSPFGVENLVRNIASQDGPGVTQVLERDPAQAGKWQGAHFVRMLDGYNARAIPVPTKTKVERLGPFSAQCEGGNVALVRGDWNNAYLTELEAFPDGPYKDQSDASGGAYRYLQSPPARVNREQVRSHSSSAFSG